jgi:uncharacterized protein YbbC (DUF1343 family)
MKFSHKIWIAALAVLSQVSSCASAQAYSNAVVLGDERFEEYLPLLSGKRVAVFSNQTGIVGDRVRGSKLADALSEYGGCFPMEGQSCTSDDEGGVFDEISLIPFLQPSVQGGAIEYGQHIVDALIEKGVDVRVIFSPEHGFRGNADAGEQVVSSVDEKTGVEIVSLYGSGSQIPDKEKTGKFDVLVVDIQDVGLRYYTYYVTMHHLMEACARDGKKVVILDRPNPNGFYVDGPVLDMDLKSGVGWLPIATVHGMTLGELARMINGEEWLENGSCDLTVIPCLNYTHRTRYSLILPPSPNIKDMRAVYLYSSTCYFEGTVASLGRGTSFPFEVYGHPEMTGCLFSFVPRSISGAKNPQFLDTLCHGVDLRGKPLEDIWSEKINLEYVIDAYCNLDMGDKFFSGSNFFELLSGADWIRPMIENGSSASGISARWASDVEAFKKLRAPYLLYSE